MLFEYNSSSAGTNNLLTPDGFNYAAKSLLEQLLNVRNGSKVISSCLYMGFLADNAASTACVHRA
jgi:hypothetical protein